MTWVKLNSGSLITYLKIEEYSSKLNDGENWVLLSLRIQGPGINIKYRFNSLLSSEIDDILQRTDKLIGSELYEDELVTLEDEFMFIFSSDSSGKVIQIRYYLDYEDRNYLAINLSSQNLIYFYNYLRLITNSVSSDDKIVRKYFETGIFQG